MLYTTILNLSLVSMTLIRNLSDIRCWGIIVTCDSGKSEGTLALSAAFEKTMLFNVSRSNKSNWHCKSLSNLSLFPVPESPEYLRKLSKKLKVRKTRGLFVAVKKLKTMQHKSCWTFPLSPALDLKVEIALTLTSLSRGLEASCRGWRRSRPARGAPLRPSSPIPCTR